MKVIFLDYDGVVNTLWFDGIKKKPYFNFPNDGKVNNYQAVMWLNELCKKFRCKIVVTSTWRTIYNYKECLYNGGLDKNIEILGKTDDLENEYLKRPTEIKKYLEEHKEIKNYLILDDEWVDKDNILGLNEHLVKTETYRGFDYYEMCKAEIILSKKM